MRQKIPAVKKGQHDLDDLRRRAARILVTERIKQGLSQTVLASRIGTNRASLSKAEHGSASLDLYARAFAGLGALSVLAGALRDEDACILQHFRYDHLPAALAAVSKPFCVLAHTTAETIPPGPERTVALRRLLEAKDAAVRAHLQGVRDEMNA